jgi:hypothetical protein
MPPGNTLICSKCGKTPLTTIFCESVACVSTVVVVTKKVEQFRRVETLHDLFDLDDLLAV